MSLDLPQCHERTMHRNNPNGIENIVSALALNEGSRATVMLHAGPNRRFSMEGALALAQGIREQVQCAVTLCLRFDEHEDRESVLQAVHEELEDSDIDVYPIVQTLINSYMEMHYALDPPTRELELPKHTTDLIDVVHCEPLRRRVAMAMYGGRFDVSSISALRSISVIDDADSAYNTKSIRRKEWVSYWLWKIVRSGNRHRIPNMMQGRGLLGKLHKLYRVVQGWKIRSAEREGEQ